MPCAWTDNSRQGICQRCWLELSDHRAADWDYAEGLVLTLPESGWLHGKVEGAHSTLGQSARERWKLHTQPLVPITVSKWKFQFRNVNF